MLGGGGGGRDRLRRGEKFEGAKVVLLLAAGTEVASHRTQRKVGVKVHGCEAFEKSQERKAACTSSLNETIFGNPIALHSPDPY